MEEQKENPTEKRLREETQKWKTKIEEEAKFAKPVNQRGQEFLDVVRSYSEDSRYFTGKGDLVRAFEAIVWAWAFYEIGKKIGILEDKPES
jgi:hypothetical protein